MKFFFSHSNRKCDYSMLQNMLSNNDKKTNQKYNYIELHIMDSYLH